MKDLVLKLAEYTGGLGFPVFVYFPGDSSMFHLENGEARAMKVPAPIKRPLTDSGRYISYFKKGNNYVVFYFIRMKMDNEDIVLVIQDTRGGGRAGIFMATVTSMMNNFEKKAVQLDSEARKYRAEAEEHSSQLGEAKSRLERTKQELEERNISDFDHLNADEDIKAELRKMVDKLTDAEIELASSQGKVKNLERTIMEQKETIEELEKGGDDADEMKNLKSALRRMELEMGDLRELLDEKNEDIKALQKEVAGDSEGCKILEKKIDEYETNLAESDDKVRELELELEEKTQALVENEESVDILRNSRSKMLKLLDGMPMPLFSIGLDYKVRNVNKASGDFAEVDKLNEMVGGICYKVIFGYDEPCPWCKMNSIVEEGLDSTNEHIEVTKDGKRLRLEQNMYPIHDREGNIDEIGEHLVDMTEQYEIINNLESARDQVRKFKKAKLGDLNEKEELKKAYGELSENYDSLMEKYQKMSKAMEKLLSEDKMNELLRTRAENAELRNKLSRAASALRNYQTNLEQSTNRFSELNKKTTYQLERLINIINNKNVLKQEDIQRSLAFANSEIERIKMEFEKQEKRRREKEAGKNAPKALEKKDDEENSEEEEKNGSDSEEKTVKDSS
ncbi:hypothetical protein [Limisalsivibrio acetivorans]|uniref:hypothetical protein n=1 Tax=Limisalsivibrio acetivorans TaxID=1304888 RepID=UPI0003B42AF0|nr:hypothetical protein [Limisalsivibrio acetivorans]